LIGVRIALPDPPTKVVALAQIGSTLVKWTASAGLITSYQVTASPGGAQQSVSGAPAGTSLTFSGLLNAQRYTFTVTATNAFGTSGSSDPSLPIVQRRSISWKAGSVGVWSDTTKWTTGELPGINDTVYLSGSGVIGLDMSVLVDSIENSGSTVTVDGDSSNHYTITVVHGMAGGRFTGVGTIIMNSSLDPLTFDSNIHCKSATIDSGWNVVIETSSNGQIFFDGGFYGGGSVWQLMSPSIWHDSITLQVNVRSMVSFNITDNSQVYVDTGSVTLSGNVLVSPTARLEIAQNDKPSPWPLVITSDTTVRIYGQLTVQNIYGKARALLDSCDIMIARLKSYWGTWYFNPNCTNPVVIGSTFDINIATIHGGVIQLSDNLQVKLNGQLTGGAQLYVARGHTVYWSGSTSFSSDDNSKGLVSSFTF
jgi:hypothetical protein